MDVINFADDTLIYSSIKNPDNAQQLINKEFNNIVIWMNKNHLKLNTYKTKLIIFSPKAKKYDSLNQIHLTSGDNVNIEQVNSCKYLGMILDKKLNWKAHIQNLKTQLSKINGILFRIRYYLNKNSLDLIFNSLILNKINYGILCYGRANDTTLKPLRTTLNLSLRCINFLKRQDKRTAIIYYEQGVLQLPDLFQLQVAKFCFKFNKNLLPSSFNQFFVRVSNIHHYGTRNSNINLYIPKQNNLSGGKMLQNLTLKYGLTCRKIY